MKTTCTPPLIHSFVVSVEIPTPSARLKSRCDGTQKNNRQQLMARNASSASRAANIVKMLLTHRYPLTVQIDKSQATATHRRRSNGRSKLAKYIDTKRLGYRQLALAKMSETESEHQILDGKEQCSQTYPQKKSRRQFYPAQKLPRQTPESSFQR